MAGLFSAILAIVIWICTPPAMWIADVLERRRRDRRA
jgi:hypothetical protein